MLFSMSAEGRGQGLLRPYILYASGFWNVKKKKEKKKNKKNPQNPVAYLVLFIFFLTSNTSSLFLILIWECAFFFKQIMKLKNF